MNKIYLSVLLLSVTFSSLAQTYEPAPGVAGSNAVHKDSILISSWAIDVRITRGYKDIANPSAGEANYGTDEDALGKAEGDGTSVVSLGDGGDALLTFSEIISNGEGPDFAVFENGFADNFIELAFVEVSSDGITFHRFPAISEAPSVVQLSAFEYTDCRYFHNLAGKYRQGYGTPFDLQDLSGANGLDIMNITHVKLIDVVGSINPSYGTLDSQGHIINDLYPTVFDSGGFDLDGVAVLNKATMSIKELERQAQIYPNPTTGFITIKVPQEAAVRVIDARGREVLAQNIETTAMLDLSTFKHSLLWLEITTSQGINIQKIIVE